MNKIAFLATTAALSFLLAACGSPPHSGPDTKLVQNDAPAYTKDYVIDPYTGFDAAGNYNETRVDANGVPIPKGELTYMESHMLTSADKHCTEVVAQISGRFMYDAKGFVRFGGLEGLGTAVGAHEAFTASFSSYFKYGGLAGAFGGVAAAEMTWEESVRVVHSYCVMTIVQANGADIGDQRLKDIKIYPLIAGKAKRPGHTPDDGSKFTRTNRADTADQRVRAATSVPPPPLFVPH